MQSKVYLMMQATHFIIYFYLISFTIISLCCFKMLKCLNKIKGNLRSQIKLYCIYLLVLTIFSQQSWVTKFYICSTHITTKNAYVWKLLFQLEINLSSFRLFIFSTLIWLIVPPHLKQLNYLTIYNKVT